METDALQPIEVPSMHQEVQNRIKDYILHQQLAAGSSLPSESELTRRLGVSRTVIREALRSLQSLGVIDSRRGDGHYVRGFNLDPIVENLQYGILFDANDVKEVLVIRERIELAFIQDAIEAMDPETIQELEMIVEDMRNKTRVGSRIIEVQELGSLFHAAIYRGIDNQLLLKLLDVFWRVIRNLRDQSLLTPADPLQMIDDHERLLKAIADRDVEQAQSCLNSHFTWLKERLV